MKKASIHGFCPHCNANLDGELVIALPLKKGASVDAAIEYASNFMGWKEHGILNRFGRVTNIYDIGSDRTVAHRCPDCHLSWEKQYV